MAKFLFGLLLLILPTAAICQSLDVPALTSGPSPDRSGRSVVRFDRKVLVQVIGGRGGEFCLYINTRSGDMGIMYGRSGELGACALNINDEKFTFMLVRAGGQIQTYTTQKKNGALKHWVSTGNTEIYPVSFPRMENAVLQRLGDSWTYNRETVSGQAYSANSSGAPTYYLHGSSQPRDVTTQNFLGHSGIGYLKSNRGIFKVVRADMGSTRFQVYSWWDVSTELDLTPFELLENLMDESTRTSLDRQEQRLRSRSFSGPCAIEEEEWRRLSLADIEARRRLNAERKRGNVFENESTRRAQSEMMIPDLAVMNQELVVKVCKANDRLSRARSGESQADIERQIQCYRRQQSELSALQAEWNAIDARFPNDSGKAYMEKNRTFGRLISIGTGCR